MSFLPRRRLDRGNNEVARALKLDTNGTAQMFSFKVPTCYGLVNPVEIEDNEKATYQQWAHQGAC